MVDKFEAQNKRKEWCEALREDQEFLNSGQIVPMENVQSKKGNCEPPPLPADLNLMRLGELIPYVQKLLLKNHWSLGGEKKRVSPGEIFQGSDIINSKYVRSLKQNIFLRDLR